MQDHWRSYRSCPAPPSPQRQSPAPEPPYHRHLETTAQKMHIDGPPWDTHTKHKQKKKLFKALIFIIFIQTVSFSHLSWGTANQYSGCFPRPPNEWAGLKVIPVAKDFLIGLPTLKQRNIGGFLLFSSDEKSISVEKKNQNRKLVKDTSQFLNRSYITSAVWQKYCGR